MSEEALAAPNRAQAEQLEARLLDSLQRSASVLAETSALVADWRALQGWKLLGFATVEDWARERCGRSGRSLFRFFEQADVVKALNVALPAGSPVVFLASELGSGQSDARVTLAGESPVQKPDSKVVTPPRVIEISQRDAQRIKPRLKEAVRSLAHGGKPEKVLEPVRPVPVRPVPKPARVLPAAEQLAFVFDEVETVLEMATEPTPENFELLRDALGRLLGVVRQGAGPAPKSSAPQKPKGQPPPPFNPNPNLIAYIEKGQPNRRPNCPKGCNESVTYRFGRWSCRKHG